METGSKLWYKKPAKVWSEALPIGNGRLGGMVFGGCKQEIIQLNEDSIWSGKPLDRHNPDAKKYLPEIRRLIREGQIPEAERLAVYALSGIPNSQRSYQTAGELCLKLWNCDEESGYERELDLEEGLVKIKYQAGETLYTREMFVSYPDGVMVIRLKAEGEQKLEFDCLLNRCHNWTNASMPEGYDTIGFQADTGAEGIAFYTALKAASADGRIQTIGEHLIVEHASEAVLYLCIETSYRQEHYKESCLDCLRRAAEKGYEELKKAHVLDYRNLYGRVSLEFAAGEMGRGKVKLPVDERLKLMEQGESDTGLLALYFQYGRYLLITSSREGALPANLQGIWNDSLTPAWDSKYTININLQMNYWAANPANLAECCLPYFAHLETVKERGKKTAEAMYGCRGSVAHHNTDIYGDTAPQDQYIPATYWVMGEAWLATHIWDYYLFTQDKEHLEEHFDVLQQCVEFFYDFLIEGPDGALVVSPSVSPENTYILPDGVSGCLCEGATMDSEILNQLFEGYVGACEVLGKDQDLIEKARSTVERLPKLRIGRFGQLQEWMEDYEEKEPGHRHISHLYGVYPGTTLTWIDTPELMQAAKESLNRRLSFGGGYTGWSRAWMIGLWARFGDGEKAYENFNALLACSTFPNLMDNHPREGGHVFQIDGNMGAAAAMAEMLVQSHNNFIRLLPALPKELETGNVAGICLRGGMVLDMKWERGEVIWFRIRSLTEQQVQIEVNGKVIYLKVLENVPYEW